MSNDNDPRDDAMREIEAALSQYVTDVMSLDPFPDGSKLLALIRSKLPQPDAEHERAVEAWHRHALACPFDEETTYMFILSLLDVNEALRLMRARPASGKDEAAGELLRAAKELASMSSGCMECRIQTIQDAAESAIAKAERAGIKESQP